MKFLADMRYSSIKSGTRYKQNHLNKMLTHAKENLKILYLPAIHVDINDNPKILYLPAIHVDVKTTTLKSFTYPQSM